MAFWEMHFVGVVLGGERLFSQCYHSHGGRLSCRYHRLLPMSSLPLVLSMEWRMAVAHKNCPGTAGNCLAQHEVLFSEKS